MGRTLAREGSNTGVRLVTRSQCGREAVGLEISSEGCLGADARDC